MSACSRKRRMFSGPSGRRRGKRLTVAARGVRGLGKVVENGARWGKWWEVEIFKKLENTEIWEFRTLYNSVCYRLLAFWDTDEDTLIIATHGIIKKTQKTPAKEIAKAENIRSEYFKRKGL